MLQFIIYFLSGVFYFSFLNVAKLAAQEQPAPVTMMEKNPIDGIEEGFGVLKNSIEITRDGTLWNKEEAASSHLVTVNHDEIISTRRPSESTSSTVEMNNLGHYESDLVSLDSIDSRKTIVDEYLPVNMLSKARASNLQAQQRLENALKEWEQLIINPRNNHTKLIQLRTQWQSRFAECSKELVMAYYQMEFVRLSRCKAAPILNEATAAVFDEQIQLRQCLLNIACINVDEAKFFLEKTEAAFTQQDAYLKSREYRQLSEMISLGLTNAQRIVNQTADDYDTWKNINQNLKVASTEGEELLADLSTQTREEVFHATPPEQASDLQQENNLEKLTDDFTNIIPSDAASFLGEVIAGPSRRGRGHEIAPWFYVTKNGQAVYDHNANKQNGEMSDAIITQLQELEATVQGWKDKLVGWNTTRNSTSNYSLETSLVFEKSTGVRHRQKSKRHKKNIGKITDKTTVIKAVGASEVMDRSPSPAALTAAEDNNQLREEQLSLCQKMYAVVQAICPTNQAIISAVAHDMGMIYEMCREYSIFSELYQQQKSENPQYSMCQQAIGAANNYFAMKNQEQKEEQKRLEQAAQEDTDRKREEARQWLLKDYEQDKKKSPKKNQ